MVKILSKDKLMDLRQQLAAALDTSLAAIRLDSEEEAYTDIDIYHQITTALDNVIGMLIE